MLDIQEEEMRQRGRALAAYNAARPFLPGMQGQHHRRTLDAGFLAGVRRGAATKSAGVNSFAQIKKDLKPYMGQ